MVDRLAELQKTSGGGPIAADDVDLIENGDDSEAFMVEFFQDAGQIKSALSRIQSNIEDISEQHGLKLAATSGDQGKKISAELDNLMEETNDLTGEVQAKLKRMEEDNKKFQKDADNAGSAEDRIRTSHHGTLTRKFVALMTEYQEIQTKFKSKYKERVERQYKIVKPDATDEEVQQVVEKGGEVFEQEILLSGSHRAVKNALSEIEDRHQDIIKLEQSINELHQLFLDMAVLVETQGELLDQIEYSVSQSVNYTQKGVDDLNKANQLQQKARNKMCCLIVIGLVIMCVILGPVLGTALNSA